MTDGVIKIQVNLLQFQLATREVIRQLDRLAKVFEDRDKFHASYEGQWPDKFVLLNRFVRTGLRPPFIIND
jgi:hypothetical protein